MATISERNRARLALRLLAERHVPHVGDYVLIWARIEGEDDGVLLAKVTTEVRERAFTEHRFPVLPRDIVLATPERP
jgi:hypothetical protein